MGSFHVIREVAICERHDTDVAVNFLEDDYQRSRNRCIRWSVGVLYYVHTRSTQRAIIDGCPVGGVFRATKSAQNVIVLGALVHKGTIQLSSLDSAKEDGWYHVDGTSSSAPDTDWGIVVVFRHNSNISHQIKLCANSANIRYRKSSSGNWSAWKSVSLS